MKTNKMRNVIVQASISPDVSFFCKPLKFGISQIKFVILLLFIMLFNNFQNLVLAQNGDSCRTAISIPLQEGYSVSQQSYLKWYSFYANDSIATLKINSDYNALPDSVIIYKGDCDSLILYSTFALDTEHTKLISVPLNEVFYVCFISTARNCTTCLISPLEYYFSLVQGDAKTVRIGNCIDPIPNCEYICNGSFEFKSACPPRSGLLIYANSWIDVLKTPEYFNSCQGSCSNTLDTIKIGTTIYPTCINIPINFAGNQSAAQNPDGTTGYAGIIAAGEVQNGNIGYAEYIGQQLNQPLEVGMTYNFTMDISWAEVSRYKAKNFGVYFSNGIANFGTFIYDQPQIVFPNFVTNSTGWTTLTGTFTPTISGLNKFYFGLFPYSSGLTNINSSIVSENPPNQTDLPYGLEASRWAYYYVDNFSLILADKEKHIEVGICPNSQAIDLYDTTQITVPNTYSNITWDIVNGLTVNNYLPGAEPYVATYIGPPTTIHAIGYIGNCPIDIYFDIEMKDLCECDAFICQPGSPPAPNQNNTNSVNTCFLPFNSNWYMSMTGVYTFYSGITYENCFLKMGPNAGFIVSNGATLTFNNSTLFACSTMWNGIVVEAGGTLIINNSRIEDALKAIEVQPGAIVMVDGCVFNKNWIGVSIESGAGSAEFTGQKMTFNCTDIDSPTSSTLLLVPHSGEHGYAGIYAYESPSLSIGNMATLGNLFTNTQYGIYAEKSSLEVVNCNFTKLYYNTTDANSNSGIYAMECDVIVGGLNTSTLYNHFSNLKYGINANYYSVTPLSQHNLQINNNEFENYSSQSTPFQRAISINGGLILDFEISDNIIEGFKSGIGMFGCNAFGEIKYNKLEGRPFSATAMYISSAAISIGNPLISKISIFENRINPNQDHTCNVGINLLTTASNGTFMAEISQNLIYKCPTGINCVGFKPNMLKIKDHDPALGAGIYLEQKANQYGIKLYSCSRASVYNNYVKAISGSSIPNSNLENKVIGIYVGGNCSQTNIKENYFWRLGTGMYYTGGYTNLPLYVTCNRMIQNVNGVNITNTDIGNQGYAAAPGYNGAAQDNQWSIPSGSAYMGAKVTIPLGQSFPTWFSRSASLPFLPNQSLKMFPQQCIVGNQAQYLVPNADYNCSFGCPNPPCQHFRIYEMAYNESPYDIMSEEELGNIKLALLYQLKNDSVLLDSLLNVGGIITNYISNLLLSEENDLANSARLLSERDTIGGIAALGGVNTNTDPRANQVIVNEIYARTWARGVEVTLPQDSIILTEIACTEPQYGGLAVFDAMAMINWDTCFYSNYNNERAENLTKAPNITKGNELLNPFKIYPNPTQSNLIVEFSNEIEIYSIIVTDVSGCNITCNFINRNNQLLIETINLAKGFYIARLYDKKNNIFNVSFVKE